MIFNRVGLRTFLAALVIACLLGGWMWIFEKDCFVSCGAIGCLMGSGAFMLLFDFWHRMAHGECLLLEPRRGGHLFFIPVWILGVVCIMGSVFVMPSRVSVGKLYAQASLSQKFSYWSASTNSPKRSEMQSAPSLVLGMISGVGAHRIATVNGQPFAQGECHTVSVGSTKRRVHCAQIREKSVVVTLDGDSKSRELKMGEPLVCRK